MAKSKVRKIVFLLSFKQPLALNIKSNRLMNQKSVLKSFQIVIYRLGTQLASLTFQEVRNGLRGKRVSDIVHEIQYNTFKKRCITYLITRDHIFKKHRVVNIM